MKSKMVFGAGVLMCNAAVVADITAYREWPMAAAAQLLTAIGAHDQGILDRVIAPGAVYFAGYEAEREKRSTLLSLDSFANVRGRCQISSIHACSAGVATIEWFCPKSPKRDQNVWSTVRLDNTGHIISVTGDTAPLVCIETAAPGLKS